MKTRSNVGRLATASITGDNIEVAGKVAAATDLANVAHDVTHPEEAVAGALKVADTVKNAVDAENRTKELLHREQKELEKQD